MTDADARSVADFEKNRKLLFKVAYRVLGSVADAEDVVQESWLRWSRVDHSRVSDPQSFLIQVSTRLALDRLRRAKASREAYVGPWLPEPLPTGPEIGEGAETADSVSMAMLVVLETLSPLERVVFVLREAFEFSFADIGAVLNRSEPAVRQIARRARAHVRERQPRFRYDRKVRMQVTERFLAACLGGDIDGLLDLLAPEVTLWSDGNGLRGVPRTSVRGAQKVSRLLIHGIQKVVRPSAGASPGERGVGGGSIVDVNGGPAALIVAAGETIAVVVVDLDPVTDRITQIWIIANQDKLGGVEGER
ncbi:RNA polymerase sigma factor SigJ [Streptosporangium amethystogenes]|uniref:RNA polymerase sigma factor SigJ n=1 Tax=Streptosporangium amethystogenes TaxID=2002 RepID=UPI0004CC2F3A|nr:RNA polymerase sigma factor SigJ [Streptosporangium amethystogenes]